VAWENHLTLIIDGCSLHRRSQAGALGGEKMGEANLQGKL